MTADDGSQSAFALVVHIFQRSGKTEGQIGQLRVVQIIAQIFRRKFLKLKCDFKFNEKIFS